jgi:L-fuconolactonase
MKNSMPRPEPSTVILPAQGPGSATRERGAGEIRHLVDVRRFDTLAGAEQVDWFFREVTGSLDREQPQDATVTWDPHPEIESREMEKVLASAEYQAGARVLARMGLSLDTGLCFPQLPELAAFAKAVPGLTIVRNHLGGLTRIGPYANRDEEVLAAWRRGIAGLADCPNVNLKLGGIGMPRMGFDWHAREKPIGSEELAASMASLMSYCIEQLGPNRCMFESNFPVDKVSFSHHVLFNAFKPFSKGYSAAERANLFDDTAARAYRIADA